MNATNATFILLIAIYLVHITAVNALFFSFYTENIRILIFSVEQEKKSGTSEREDCVIFAALK